MSLDAPTPFEEIEITPEMIEAGAEVIAERAREIAEGWESPRIAAVKVWRAMRALSGTS